MTTISSIYGKVNTLVNLKYEKILSRYGQEGRGISDRYGKNANDVVRQPNWWQPLAKKEVVKYDLDCDKFFHDYKGFWHDIFNKADLPHDSKIDCSVKRLPPVSHGIHTDGDNGMGVGGDSLAKMKSQWSKTNQYVYCRFSLPLSSGGPTVYFNECIPYHRFAVKRGSTHFSIIQEDTWKDVEYEKLEEFDNSEKITIDKKKHKLTHLNDDQLQGLSLREIAEWKEGQIHLFPCNMLHASSDDEDYDEKWFLTGVIYGTWPLNKSTYKHQVLQTLEIKDGNIFFEFNRHDGSYEKMFQIPKDKTILDLGSGDFHYKHRLSENAIGTDKRLTRNEDIVHLDLNKEKDYLQFEPASFSCITSFAVLHWVQRIDVCIENTLKLLNDDGVYFHYLWNYDVFESEYANILAPNVNWDQTPKFKTDVSSLRTKFEKHGFLVDYCRELPLYIDHKKTHVHMIIIHGMHPNVPDNWRHNLSNWKDDPLEVFKDKA